MSIFERLWDLLGLVFGGTFERVGQAATSVFGSANARHVAKLQERVEKINALEPKYEAFTDEELRAQTELFRKRLRQGETLDDLLVEAFAVCREGGKRFLNMRHYDVQLIGGMVLHAGGIAEMVTGEGKTLVATLPAYLNALEGKGVHVITVNDYLARRDMEWMAPLCMNLGLTINAIQSGMSTQEKQAAYQCDITYGTNNEFGFDYLRDNMRPAAKGDDRFPSDAQQCQGPLNYAIIDEVDNILIDEARTPLIISGPADLDLGRYADADRVARQLQKELHFTVDEKQHNVTLTDEGVRAAEELAGVESFYTAGNMEWPHLIDNALKAHYLYKLDVNYVIKDQQIVIVDEFTGRLMEGRQWSDGLHQACEAKEGVPIKQETQTFATASLQNIFKMYKKLSGMTGTAMTEADEFWKIYKLDVVAIPTHREMQRIEHADLIYLNEKDKFRAIADDVERAHKWDVVSLKDGSEIWGKIQSEADDAVMIVPKNEKQPESVARAKIVKIERAGRPVLVGTVSIEKSERLSHMLETRGITHNVLNAKQHGREAEIVAQAGRIGAVTIATNMAGRGTDIILGGNPETMAWAQLQHTYPTRLEVPDDVWKKLVDEIDEQEQMSAEGEIVRDLGGLYVLGTERHESRRIDLQLRGRCGRQGDPGGSRFFLSLEDDLMRIFAGDFVKSVMERMGMKEGEAIESSLVTRRIAAAQKKVEERNFEIRKSLLEYDEVMDEQRKRVYRYRQNLLDGHSSRNMILGLIRAEIESHVDTFLEPNYGIETFANYAGTQLQCQLDARDFSNMDFEMADSYAKDQAERKSEVTIAEAVEENLPSGMEEEWNWKAMATWANTRLQTNYQDHQLKNLDREEMLDDFVEKAHALIASTDLSEGEPLLDAEYGLRVLCAWMRNKFGIETTPDEFRDVDDSRKVSDTLMQRAEAAYTEKEAEYPVLTGISRFTEKQGTQVSLDREGLIAWVQGRFNTELSVDEIKLNRDDLKLQLIQHSKSTASQSVAAQEQAIAKVAELFSGADDESTALLASGDSGQLESLVEWLGRELDHETTVEDLSRMDRAELTLAVQGAVDDRFYPEMRRMERQILLNIVDDAWKNHLLTMDHLRSSVGLKGYAQMDPKVEYKREGMRMFETMWGSIGERVSELIFRMESFNEAFIRSTWVDARPRHDDAHEAGSIARMPSDTAAQRAASGSEGRGDGEEVKPEPIRKDEPRIGRNSPCPCGSGKKYKSCCMRKMV
ncbi:preprotein translocase subunit SecA [Allorhodopirellula heiligendammensis]|uniref:Protein translocase subunit SecA n=1 Tax=Allorhodopirellula heiligendammensis TaxID=2714739 RepID=A0A5C6C6G7_9BACT|nr:preprotein translocase subunit SecA [Allorhodopirellula heiligendammensis]TWU19071.1 preprotein translocase subunit SecA [Allorhodopirellula heiligendammensis]